MTTKYTRELLEPIVNRCVNVAQVVRALGLKPGGSSSTHIAKVIKALGLGTHFTGQRQQGEQNNQWRSADQVLVLDAHKGRREPGPKLRWALVESGVPEICEQCQQGTTWNGKPLRLQVDHLDGNPVNNVKENLRFLCPNCHTQTDNFGALNSKVPRRVVRHPTGPWRGPRPEHRRVDYDQVRLRYAEVGSYEAVGREFGVTGTSVKKIVRGQSESAT